MEPVTECSYIGCGKQYARGLQFHQVPVNDSALCVKWLISSGLEEFLSQESNVLESMNLAICSDHFRKNNYLNEKTLKKEAVPRQYWDHGYSHELGEIREADIDRHLQNYSDDCLSSIDSESDSDNQTGDEFQTQLGNEIEVLLNSLQNLAGRSRHEKKINIGESLRDFYKKLNSRGNRYKNKSEATSTSDLMKFQRATRNMCRTCAEKKNNLVDIDEEAGGLNIGMLTKLKLLIEIKEQDVLPKKICQECLVKLEQSYEFFQQIYRADNTLRDMLFAYYRSGKNVSNKSKYNGHASVRLGNSKTNNNSSDDKTEDLCSDINDMPFQTVSKYTEGIDNGIRDDATNNVYESDSIYRRMNDGKNIRDKSSLNGEAYSSENTENTVSYLLSDFADNDAELSWLDVVGVMEKKHKPEALKTNTTSGELLTCMVQISCKYCEKSFKLRRQLKTHITMRHLRPINCICEYCNICFRSREHLSIHREQAHSEQRYKCNDCKEEFSNKKDLRLHIQRIHPEIGSMAGDVMDIAPTPDRNQIFSCNDCKETFSSKKTLCNHIHRLHPPFSYTCTICKSVMYSEDDTYKHMSTHNHSPLFPCLDCGRMFYSKDKLEKHKITHAKSMPKKRKKVWFHCQLCDASYSMVDRLIKHIETHLPEDWENYRNKILYCGECNARIIGKEKFRLHKMRYHLAKRGDFVCLLCDDVTQEFESLGDYKKHIESHSNELKCSIPQRYKCEHCNKAFESNSHCINHVKSFHSDLMQSCLVGEVKLNDNENLKDHSTDKMQAIEEQRVRIQDSKEERISPCLSNEEFLTVKQEVDHGEANQKISESSKKLFPETEDYICDRCDVKFSSTDILKQHNLDAHKVTGKVTDTHTSEKNVQSKYLEDEKTSDEKIALDGDVVETHSDDKITLDEDVAETHSDEKIVLDKDVAETHADEKKGFFEDGMKLGSEDVVKDPPLTHDKQELSYKCQYCEKQFGNDEDKKDHEVNHNLNNTKSNGGDLSN